MSKVGWEAIWEAAKILDSEISGLSWSGFNIAGDRKSIDEVRRLMNQEDRLKWFELHYKSLIDELSEARTEVKNLKG